MRTAQPRPDMTNRELFDNLRAYLDSRLEEFATKEDLAQMEIRLTRKLESHKQVYVQQHLAVRADIGHLHREIGKVNDRIDRLQTTLAQASAA